MLFSYGGYLVRTVHPTKAALQFFTANDESMLAPTLLCINAPHSSFVDPVFEAPRLL